MKRKFFDSTAGMVHYFVRPEDYFVLNSLEKLDWNEYTYRLLREEGYERVLFIEEKVGEGEIYAYDKLSQLSYGGYAQDFVDVDIRNKESLQAFYQKVEGKKAKNTAVLKGMEDFAKGDNAPEKVKEFGKRVVARFGGTKVFLEAFTGAISTALKAQNIKTAFVVQLETFEQAFNRERENARKDAANFTDAIRVLQRENVSLKNIILFTCKDENSFVSVFNDSALYGLHDWLPKVVGDRSSEHNLQKAVRMLKERNRIVVVDSVGEDEIANLLLRKRIVEKDKRLKDLEFTKVYDLAKMLREHLLQKRIVFNTIGSGKVDEPIKVLDHHLSEDDFVEELLGVAERLGPKVINRVEAKSLYVERVAHDFVEYIESDDEAAVLTEFDKLVGDEMQSVKQSVIEVVNYFKVKQKKVEEAIKKGKKVSEDEMPFMNMRFLGAPGTGKTTIAKLTAKLLHAKGILPTDRVVRKDASEMVKGHVGETGDLIRKAAEEANGGVLLIDEFYAFNEAYNGGNVANEAMNALLSVINEHRNTLCVIVAGYEEKVEAVFRFNVGGDSRFPHRINLPNYSIDTLMVILDSLLERDNKVLEEGVREKLRKIIAADMGIKGEAFGNGRYIKELLEKVERKYCARGAEDDIYTNEDVLNAFPEKRSILSAEENTVEAVLAEFDKLVGDEMQSVKQSVIEVVNYFKAKQKKVEEAIKKGKKVSEDELPFMNMQFLGAPGTGKTTIAKLTAKLLHAKGILPTDRLVKVEAVKMVTGHVGKTGELLREAAEGANGGVLLIDEFYAFNEAYDGGNVANEAMNALLSVINEHRNTLCVIVAGYEKKVEAVFRFNEGGDSRFPHKINLPNYSIDTLMVILDSILERDERRLEEGVREKLRKVIVAEMGIKGEAFGNGRYIKELLGKVERKYYARGAEDDIYTNEDVDRAFPQTAIREKAEICYRKMSANHFASLKSAYPEKEYTDTELCAVTESSVLFVKTDRGSGTAFLISPEGYALTCHHVIDGAEEINARLRVAGCIGGLDSWHKCTVVNADKAYDMALIKLEGSNFPYLNFASPDRTVNRGEHFVLSGYPFGEKTANDMTTYYGQISSGGMQVDDRGIPCYNINCEAKMGDSGAPIIANADGKVIGILQGSMTHSGEQLTEEINYMRAISYFWELFTE